MKCDKCGGKLKVTNTYSLEKGKTQRIECQSCRAVYTSEIRIYLADRYGTGARAAATRMKKESEPAPEA